MTGIPDNDGLDAYLAELKGRVSHQIALFLPRCFTKDDATRFAGPPTWAYDEQALTSMIAEPAWDLLSRPAKRWRPVFGVLMLEALGRSAEPYLELFGALAELPHTGSLIIDDMQDASRLRRGEESIHLRYGEAKAVNAANALYFLPQLLLIDHPHLTPPQQLAIHEIINRWFVRGHFGQAMDLHWSEIIGQDGLLAKESDVLRAQVLQMYECKTAAATISLAETALVIADANEEVREVCLSFAGAVGVAFQIVDDIHSYSRSKKWLKECGEDLDGGKLTLVLIEALAVLRGAKRERLIQIVKSNELRATPAGAREAAELVRGTDAFETCRDKAWSLFDTSRLAMTARLRPTKARDALFRVCERLLRLDFEA